MSKLVKISLVVVAVGLLIAYIKPDVLYNPTYIHNTVGKIPFLTTIFKYFHGEKSRSPSQDDGSTSTPVSEDAPLKIFTKEELAQYKGENGGDIYLSLMGKVFDVSGGRDFYGPGGGYSFFSGVDGSRAFVTGDFSAGITDDITGLEDHDYIGLRDWVDFYEKSYILIGKLNARYYDVEGNPTEYYHQVQKWIKAAAGQKEEENQLKEKYPMCNVDYKPEEGSRVWCSPASGGVQRDWTGVPRSLHLPDKSIRCACVQESDASDPMFEEYPNCPKDAVSCMLPN